MTERIRLWNENLELKAENERLRAFALRVLSVHSVVSEMRADAAATLAEVPTDD